MIIAPQKKTLPGIILPCLQTDKKFQIINKILEKNIFSKIQSTQHKNMNKKIFTLS
jgi:hypothetical protein